MKIAFKSLFIASLALAASASATAAPAGDVKNIVLVHGAFADGSGWKAVNDIPTNDGYRVSIAQPPETSLEDDVASTRRLLDQQDGPTILVGPARFHADFAADLPVSVITDFMAKSQVPLSVRAATTPVTTAAWKTKPSYAILSTQDHTINPELQRFMYRRSGSTVVEVAASHGVYVSQPQAVAALIEQAATNSK